MNQHQSVSSDKHDVFDMDRLANSTAGHQSAAPIADSMVQPAALRPIHFAVASAAIALVWIMWPATNEPPLARPQSNARMLNTGAGTEGQAPRPLPRPEMPSAPPGLDQAGAVTPTPATATTAAIGETGLQANILELQAQQATALIKAVDNLNSRTSALEARMAAPKPTINAAPVRRVHTLRPANGVAQAPILESFTLNTIFDGQAWIAHDERVFVVREGDMIDDIKVIRINAGDHRVLTSRGVVR